METLPSSIELHKKGVFLCSADLGASNVGKQSKHMSLWLPSRPYDCYCFLGLSNS